MKYFSILLKKSLFSISNKDHGAVDDNLSEWMRQYQKHLGDDIDSGNQDFDMETNCSVVNDNSAISLKIPLKFISFITSV